VAEQRVQRRLAAILVADVVGYSRLMGDDEAGTLARIRELRGELIEPKVAQFGGRVVKTTGDGFLMEFPSAVDAVQHAIDVQGAMARREADTPDDQKIELRIGINLGDVIVEDDDIYGDGVNIAARLEELAEPGGIYLSDMVHGGVRNKLDVAFDDLGEHSVKNIADPIHVYRVHLGSGDAVAEPTTSADSVLRRPPVAVLPFENLSGDAEQEYFADGLTEDIITALSVWRLFPVIARNSTFSYKGKSPDIRKVGEELGARYVVEGSVRRAGERVRVTAQLINSETGHHVWAERYDRELADIFDLQDEITRRIVVTLVPELERAEREKTVAKPPQNLDAWDCYLHGVAHLNELSADAIPRARDMFQRAIALDPNYAKAHARLAQTYLREIRRNVADDVDDAAERMMEAARAAVHLDDGDSLSHWIIALAYRLSGQYDLAVREAQRALQLNPADVDAHFTAGTTLYFAGRPEEAIPHIESAIRLSPNDPRSVLFHHGLAIALFNAHRFEGACEWAMKAMHEDLSKVTIAERTSANLIYLSSLGHLGRVDEARAFLDRTSPEQLRIGAIDRPGILGEVERPHFLDGLRKAGWEG
jgi:adenylate cyclase